VLIKKTKQAEPSAIDLDRRLRVFYRCNRELFQAQSEQELLQSICQILVTGDDLRLVWIGYSEKNSEKTVRPVAKAGRALGFLEQVKISWVDSKTGQDPAGMAVRTGKAYPLNNIQVDRKDSPWLSAAVAHGFESCIALPLVAHHEQLGAVDLHGVLSLYSARPEAFDDGAIEFYAELATCLTLAVTMLRGNLAGGLSYDVTALRAAEERKRAADALRSARIELARVMQMTAMGQMAASIAHEVNQPLAAIVANGNAGLNWLSSGTPDLHEVRECLERIVKDGFLAGEVIGGIRSMFKKNGRAEIPQDANEIVREVLALMRGEIETQQVLIQSNFAEELPQIPANRVQLQQVIVNLIMNAVDAMSTVGDRARILRVKTEIHEFNNLLITVEDTGTGIDPKIINRLFDAFFTTKSEGMGMGLSICRSIIESHGGRLWMSPGQPYGSTFHVLLPTGGKPRS
jgi:signal transduction histidine kinase